MAEGCLRKPIFRRSEPRRWHSLVAGLFIPQFDNADTAVIIVADPEWDEFKERLSRFSKEEIGRAVSQVAYAKELAILELPHTANTLVRADGSDEEIPLDTAFS